MLIQHKGVCLDVIMFAIFNCCCSGVPVPLCGKTNGSWCCSMEAQLQEAWPWVGDRVAPQVSICPWCSLWALLWNHHLHAGSTSGDEEHNVQGQQPCSGLPASSWAPPGGEGLPCWEGCWPGVHTWVPVLAQLQKWCNSCYLSLLVWCVYRALQLQRARYYYYSYILNIILCI